MTDEERLRLAFEDVPHIEDPTDDERKSARTRYPDAVVPDDGAIPDPHHYLTLEADVLVPKWVELTVRDKIHRRDGPMTPDDVNDMVIDVVQVWERFLAPDGTPIADAVLEKGTTNDE